MRRPTKTRLQQTMRTAVVIVCFALGMVAATKLKPHVSKADCVGCGDCVQVCPKQKEGATAIYMIDGRAVIDPAVCIACEKCVAICSFKAVRK